jgi:prephenate dehydratase
MAKKKIIFQGEPGANSHIACREAYPDHEPIPCPTFEDCFSALLAGDVDLGMIPIENSVAGRVADIHHLMPTSGLHIIAEWFLPIRNQLMASKARASRPSKRSNHVMALDSAAASSANPNSNRWLPPTSPGLLAAWRKPGCFGDRVASRRGKLDSPSERMWGRVASTTRFIVLSREKWA